MFPSLKGRQLLAILCRAPLSYSIVRAKGGSHRKMESSAGYPTLTFAFHDGADIPRGAVKKVLTADVGLTEEEALKLL